ncbi:MAG: Smr/MutS family protein [Myxococcota bacterium]
MPTRLIPAARLGGTINVDLRGLRVDEALIRLDEALDLAAAEGRDEIHILHGIGTGVLRRAVRDHLSHSHYILEWTPAMRDEGGPAATRAILMKE